MGSSIGTAFLAAQSGLQEARESRLLQQAKASPLPDNDTKIEKSARDFEAILVGTWLQQAEQSFASVPGGSGEDDDASGGEQMMSLGIQALSSSIAGMGGIGIASMVSKALHKAQPASTDGPEPSKT